MIRLAIIPFGYHVKRVRSSLTRKPKLATTSKWPKYIEGLLKRRRVLIFEILNPPSPIRRQDGTRVGVHCPDIECWNAC